MKARSFLLVVVCALAVLAGTAVALRAEAKQEQSKAELEKQLQQLMHQRAKTAEHAVEALQAAFDAETITLDVFLDAVNKRAEARLAVATTPAAEIDALQQRVHLMRQIEQRIKVLFEIGSRGGEAKEYAMAQRERQSAEIALIESRLKAIR